MKLVFFLQCSTSPLKSPVQLEASNCCYFKMTGDQSSTNPFLKNPCVLTSRLNANLLLTMPLQLLKTGIIHHTICVYQTLPISQPVDAVVNSSAFLGLGLAGKVIRFQRPDFFDPNPLLVNSVRSSQLNNTACLNR